MKTQFLIDKLASVSRDTAPEEARRLCHRAAVRLRAKQIRLRDIDRELRSFVKKCYGVTL